MASSQSPSREVTPSFQQSKTNDDTALTSGRQAEPNLEHVNAALRIRTGAGMSDPINMRPPPDWSEDSASNVPRRHLGFWQILALLINSVVGTGIFTQPGYVLFLTKNKQIALGLWAAGGLYTAVTMLIFVEYGIALPFNGGPLIYLDECFPNPKLLVITVYSIHRILLSTSESITRTLGVTLLRLANPGASIDSFSNGTISLLSILVILTVCLLIYFAPPLVFATNLPLAIFKVVLIFVVGILGLAKLSGQYEGKEDFAQTQSGFDGVGTVQAMIYVIFSYQGFINTNCIAGEINNVKKELCRASAVAMIIITGCYMFFTSVLYVVLSYADLTSPQGRNDAASLLMAKCFPDSNAMLVAEGIAALGTLLVQVYTVARVKQATAWRRIIPFWKFIGRESHFDSPGGALLLHGIFTAIPLLALRNSDASVRSFATGIYTWGHQVIMFFLGIGLLRLGKAMQSTAPSWRFTYLRTYWAVLAVAGIFAASNLTIAVMTALPNNPGEIPRYMWVIVTAAVVAGGVIYWASLRSLMVLTSKGTTFGSMIGLEPHILDFREQPESASTTPLIWEAMHEGNPRFVTYEISSADSSEEYTFSSNEQRQLCGDGDLGKTLVELVRMLKEIQENKSGVWL